MGIKWLIVWSISLNFLTTSTKRKPLLKFELIIPFVIIFFFGKELLLFYLVYSIFVDDGFNFTIINSSEEFIVDSQIVT